MENQISIPCSPNVDFSLKIIREALAGLPEGEIKGKAQKAIHYLARTVRRGRDSRIDISPSCPAGVALWPSQN